MRRRTRQESDVARAAAALFYRLVLSSPFAEILQAWGVDESAPVSTKRERRVRWTKEHFQRQYFPTSYFAGLWGVTPKAARKILAKLGGREVGNAHGHRWHVEALKLREER